MRAADILHSLPSRLRLSWEVKSVSSNDEICDQIEYAKTTEIWEAFQENPPDKNSNKMDI